MMAAMSLKTDNRLKDLLQGIIELPDEMDRVVGKPCLDSRQLATGDLFLACAGQTVHGFDYVDLAIEKEVSAILWEANPDIETLPFSWRKTPQGNQVPLVAIPNLSQQVGVIADRYYEHPSDKLFVTGITGTNGKTSCSQFLAQVLSEDRPCGVIGTLGNGLYGKLNESSHTTPDAVACQTFMSDLLDDGVSDLVMEVSSHALEQGRVNGVKFDCAVFTNLSRDHLDYHGDMQAYAEAKAKLFGFDKLKFAVVNVDDEFGRELSERISEPVQLIRYGISDEYLKPDVFASQLNLSSDGLQFEIETPWGRGAVSANLMGQFNVSNLLAVLSVLILHGMSLNEAIEKLSDLNPVSGRMESLHQQDKPAVVIDYAHTPDALEQVLFSLRAHCAGQLWCVFGCGGDRDKGKRPLMGEIADRLADVVVLTNDNPRTEPADAILADIQTGLTGHSECHVMADRASAIAYAIKHACSKDIVLIAGKGHEDYQLIGEQRLSFSDMEEARKQLGLVA
ncbi:MAG: UDP-N-acetylmuramoyl-L-alanyl-D-glutamate--2,6-diaminopimelate ligase [Gammaproteobacteria bacterium]|nr:UDP-N-acetylmuramoyl-L-alanyl-D-glutamate--2,6-diaminopimelate ligase [Gammaproteobacteria bacterium]